jgi:hypothetical protein
MPNKVKYNPNGSEENSLFAANWALNTSPKNTGSGPSSSTGFYAGPAVPSINGYVVYHDNTAFVANSDTELIEKINTIGGSAATAAEALEWAANNSVLVTNIEYNDIITDGLVYNIDAGFSASYPGRGEKVYALTSNGSGGDFINGLSVDSAYGIPAFNFEGTNGFINMSPMPFVENTSVATVEVLFYAPPNTGYWNPYHRGTLFYQGFAKGKYGYGTSFGLRIQENNQMLFFGVFSDALAYNMWTPGEWTHVVCKVQGGTAYFYKNGVYSQARGMNGVKGINIKTTGAYIGKQRDVEYLAGSITLVRAYDRFLSDEEVAQNFKDVQARYSKAFMPSDGLKLFLDSRNPASYDGGDVWMDLAQGIKFNRYGTALPVLDILGDPTLEFNSSGYWQSESGHELVDMAGDTTLLMWLKAENIAERDTVFEKAGIQYNSYEHEIAVTWEADEQFSWYSRKSSYDYGRTSSIGTAGDWKLVGIRMSTGKIQGTARQGWYSIDGGAWTSNYTARGTNAILPAGPIRVGSGYAGPMDNGGIAMVAVYDRQLTDGEVADIFNKQKSYFGL